MRVLTFLPLALLAGCSGGQTRLVCPPLVEWTAPTQRAATSELEAIPAAETVAIRSSLRVFTKQRDVVRACRE